LGMGYCELNIEDIAQSLIPNTQSPIPIIYFSCYYYNPLIIKKIKKIINFYYIKKSKIYLYLKNKNVTKYGKTNFLKFFN